MFAYGSLVSPASAAATIGRDRPALRPATLSGWRRGFTLIRDNRTCEKTFARSDDGSVPDYVLALNVDRGSTGDLVNGALITVDVADLDRLDRREIRYRRIEVGDAVATATGNAPECVYTYVARPEHHATSPPAGAVVLNSYERAVEEAFAGLGADELARYRATTDRGTAERIDAHLLAGEIPRGNPRAW